MTVDPNSPQVVAGSLTEQEASAVAGHLESLGIQSHVWCANSTVIWPEIPRNVQVVVRHVDFTRAKEAIDQLRGQGSDHP